jgi:hypothetical protein
MFLKYKLKIQITIDFWCEDLRIFEVIIIFTNFINFINEHVCKIIVCNIATINIIIDGDVWEILEIKLSLMNKNRFFFSLYNGIIELVFWFHVQILIIHIYKRK